MARAKVARGQKKEGTSKDVPSLHDHAEEKTEKPVEKKQVDVDSFAMNRKQLATMSKIASRFEQWKPAEHALKEVISVPTIFLQLDRLLGVGGWPTERVCLVHGPSAGGKAQPLDSEILTPAGFRKLRDLNVGDVVIAGDGTSTKIVGYYPKGELQIFRVDFSDGTSTECCEDHLWFTTTKNESLRGRCIRGPRPERKRIATGCDGEGSVKTLSQIMQGFEPLDHVIPLVQPVEYNALGFLPIDPYLLGLMLGDGSFGKSNNPCFHNPEKDLKNAVRVLLKHGDTMKEIDDVTDRINGGWLKKELIKLELWGLHSWEKFIPELYMRASVEDRIALLRGLLDTDGYVCKGVSFEYSSSSLKMAAQVVELARSLGAYVTESDVRVPVFTYKGERREGKPNRRIKIRFDNGIVPVSSLKHLSKFRGSSKRIRKAIVAIKPSRVAEAACIRIDHPSCLYVTNDFIVTHNTSVLIGLMLSFLKRGHFAAMVDAERTTPMSWAKQMMGEYANSPAFRGLRPESYEQTASAVREWCNVIGEAKESGEIPADTGGIVVIDSIRKLVPKKLLETLMKEQMSASDDEPKETNPFRKSKPKGIDGLGGRAAQFKAALNAAWMDEMVPLLEQTGTTMVIVSRESENTETGFFVADDFKVNGGKALYYDSSIVLRVVHNKWLKNKSGETMGERHEVILRKTKVGNKTEKEPSVYFHTFSGNKSNGEGILTTGFDLVRDLVEDAVENGIIQQSGAWFHHKGEAIGQGVEQVIDRLKEDPELRVQIEAECRASFT